MGDRMSMGYIKIDRKILKWRWATDVNTFNLFVHILVLANYKDAEFKGEVIKRGQLATSYESLSIMSGLSYSQVRTSLSHIQKTGEVTITRRPRYVVITVVKYDEYQDDSTQIARNSHADRNQIARKSQQYKNSKESKEGKEINKGGKAPGRSAPISPNGDGERRTVEDIPERIRKFHPEFKTYEDYERWANQ